MCLNGDRRFTDNSVWIFSAVLTDTEVHIARVVGYGRLHPVLPEGY